MRELKVVGLDVDGRRIICETDDSTEKFVLRSDDRLKAAVVKSALGEVTLLEEIDKLLGKPWDDELETFRHAGDGAPVRWLHQVV